MGCKDSKDAATSSSHVSEAQPPSPKSSAPVEHKFNKMYNLLTGDGDKLGEGQFAIVRRGVSRSTGQIVAVKCIELAKLTKEDEEALAVEVDVMKHLKHPNLVQFVDYFEDTDYSFLVMELMTGGELFTRIVEKEKYSEAEAQRLVRTLTEAIGYCHSQGVVHRDLKPENILLANPDDDAPLKIADFGFAKFDKAHARVLTTACGTPGYVAPEILMGHKYGREVDVWSLGVIFYILLCGYPPFHSANQARLFELIKAGQYEFDDADWKDISEEAKDLIRKILVVDPSRRYTTQQILSHPWVVGAASDAPLTATISQLKVFNARRKLKAGMNAVRSTVRVRMMLNALKAGAAAAASSPSSQELAAATPLVDDEMAFDGKLAAVSGGTPTGAGAGGGGGAAASSSVNAPVPTMNPLFGPPPGMSQPRQPGSQ